MNALLMRFFFRVYCRAIRLQAGDMLVLRLAGPATKQAVAAIQQAWGEYNADAHLLLLDQRTEPVAVIRSKHHADR